MIKFRREIDPDDGLAERSLQDYLDHELAGKSGRNLTRAIEEANARLIQEPIAPESARADGLPRVPVGFPWLTPVLGTGIVDLGLKDGGRTLAARIDGFSGGLADVKPVGNVASAAEIAQGFVNQLADHRLGKWRPASNPAAVDCEGAARLALAVALLTRLHHLTLGLVGSPTPRWEEEPHPVLPKLVSTGGDLTKPLLAAAKEQLEWLDGHGAAHISAPICQLVSQARSALLDRRLPSPAELRLLTECVWYETAKDTLTYPGWSDLMLGLAMEYPPPIAHQDGWARPPYQVVSDIANAGIIGRYQNTARNSWKARVENPDRQQTLHDLFALVLKAQAGLWNRNEGPWTVPSAAAFVTGFDLELELALLGADQPFVLAMPAFVEKLQGATETSILWFYRCVEPAQDEEEDLPMFQPGRWRVLSGAVDLAQRPSTSERLPVVVRLTGCPGVTMPDLSDVVLKEEVSKLLVEQDWTRMTVRPAYVLDEFVAGALGATETFLNHLDRARLGLPKRITGVPGGINAMFARYWLAVGVQIADSSIRHRLVSQLTAPQLSSAQPRNRPATTGLVVNRRIGPMDARTMRWLGFDVVADEGATLIPHLEHYLAHLNEPERRCSVDGGCTIGGVS